MPKNLVSFSDGTGNSAGALFKTNVWRLYQALDLKDPADPAQPLQLTCYDDGVGSSSFKPLTMRDYTLSDRVQRACHALALDDERNAFHPWLWNDADDSIDPARPPQWRPAATPGSGRRSGLRAFLLAAARPLHGLHIAGAV